MTGPAPAAARGPEPATGAGAGRLRHGRAAARWRGWTRWSLRVRLSVVTAGLLCVTLVVGAVVLTTVLSRGRVADLDDIVRHRVATVDALVTADRVPEALPVAEPGEVAQVLYRDGRVLASSTNASRTLPVLPAQTLAELRTEASGDLRVTTARTAYDDQARVGVRAAVYRGTPVVVVASVPLGEVQGLLHALRVSLGVVVPLLTLVLGVAVWVALGRALHPVEQLRRAAAQVARSGGPGSLPVPRADDELGALARTLNEMLDRLEVAAARQRTFVADAAHELRSPLAVLRTEIEVARTHPEPTSSAELAAELEPEVLRMQALVDDLLLLARVGSTPTVRAEVDLAAVVRDVVTAVPADGAAGVQVHGAGTARGDVVALGRVVRNLLTNALRHATTTVRVSVRDGAVVVEDDGHGVPEEDRERVFERFVRLDEAREREAGGSGLGLAIAREIARDQGGDVVLGDSVLGGLRAELQVPVAGRTRTRP